MDGRDGASQVGGNMQGGYEFQQRLGASLSSGLLHTPTAVRSPPATTTIISLASPGSDGAGSPHTMMNMNIGQGGNYSSGIGSSGMSTGIPNAGRPEVLKRKRGRPRKYSGVDGGIVNLSPALALSPAPPKGVSSPSEKRGRPPGSGKKQKLAALGALAGSGVVGTGFTPHVITIAAGEDVATKIYSFCQQGPRAVCMLSANGSISNVTLRHDSSFGGSITYEGRYEILSLSGSFLHTDVNGVRGRTGGLSVSLAASDGKVVGGSVAGLLIAATPVQVVVGSFAVPEVAGSKAAQSPGLPAGNGESMVNLMSFGLSTPTGNSGMIGGASSLPTGRPPKIETIGSKGSSAGGAGSSGNHQGAHPISPHLGQFQSWQPPNMDTGRRANTDINISLPGG